MKSILLKAFGILLISMLIMPQSAFSKYGPPAGNGSGESGEEIETLGNNLSVPVVFPESIGLKGTTPTVEDFRGEAYPAVNLNTPIITSIDLNGDKIFQDEEQNRVVYLQKTENTWQAEWGNGSQGNPENVVVDWGDNIVNKAWSVNSKIRVENVMFTENSSGMFGYEMGWVKNQGKSEVWGTTGVETQNLPTTVFSPNARLTIEKLDQEGGNSVYTVFNHAVWEGYGLSDSDKNRYSAEINVGGKVIYGYNWDLRGSDFPVDITKDGWYRLTFSIDKLGKNIENQDINGNVNFSSVANTDGEGKFTPIINTPDETSSSMAISILEIQVKLSQRR